MPPSKSGKSGRRLGVCALWGTEPIEGVSSACISCTHDTINWTRHQVSDGIHSRSPPGNPVGQRINTPQIVRVSKLTDMVSFRDVSNQYSNILGNMLLTRIRAGSRTPFFSMPSQ
jgi:hypothetical protein